MKAGKAPKLRSKDLPFDFYGDVAYWIDAVVDGYENEDKNLDAILDELHGSGRYLDPEAERWVQHYYLHGYWRLMDESGEYDFPERGK